MYLLPTVCQVLNKEIMSYSLHLPVLIILWRSVYMLQGYGGWGPLFRKQIERGDKVLNFTLI